MLDGYCRGAKLFVLLILFRPLELLFPAKPDQKFFSHIGGPIFASFSGSICLEFCRALGLEATRVG